MKRKFGIIVRIPNYILDNCPESHTFIKEIGTLIKDYMNIDVDSCKIDVEQYFNADISIVRLTALKPVRGLIEYCSFDEFIHKNFPI